MIARGAAGMAPLVLEYLHNGILAFVHVYNWST